jgi:hypothetical protein
MTGSILVLGMGFAERAEGHDHRKPDHALLCRRFSACSAREKGMNFALLASIVFGRKGYMLASGLLSTLLLGWYAVQTGITGALISSTYDLNYVAMTIIAGLLYVGITFVGVRGLALDRRRSRFRLFVVPRALGRARTSASHDELETPSFAYPGQQWCRRQCRWASA